MYRNNLVQQALRLLTRPIETGKPNAAQKQSKALASIPTLQPGDRISWLRADGTTHTGLIDVVHVDEDAQHWAFVTLGESWAAVNMKFVKGSGHE